MTPISRFISEPSTCAYLPEQKCQMEYEAVAGISRNQLQEKIETGWRRQGYLLFRPVCPSCNACQSLRVLAPEYQPDRSQRRVIRANERTTIEIGKPTVTYERVDLYVKHHEHHAQQKGWKACSPRTAASRIGIFISAGNHIEEWAFRIDGKLVAISYVDALEDGLSGVYFYHHPDFRKYSLGTWCVIQMIARAAELGLPYAYLGYFVKGCRSMEYKGRFGPAEYLTVEGQWQTFQRLNE